MRSWLLGFHLIGVVLWMGGLLTFSRILGYHSKEQPAVRSRFSFLEGRLNGLVALPGAVLTILFGVWMTIDYGKAWFRVAIWLHYKLTAVIVVAIIHVVLTVKQRQVARQSPDVPLNRALYASLHGIIGLLVILIILLATHQPMSQQ
jgi:putative membrane protein